mmetsp:Transcript_10474/g.18301  ORF Transcript_10474/g.18301 Transcript_10474/m.18301 type:complete len:315 (+) Transcript_10474:3-947(+)
MESLIGDWVMQFMPVHTDNPPVPVEPPSSFLLGNKWMDYGLAIAAALVIPVVRSVLRSTVYEPVGMALMFSGRQASALTGKQKERLKKWNESFWKMSIFLSFTILALAISVGELWFWDTRYFWLGCNQFPCNLTVSRGLLVFYCIETGFYIQAIHFLAVHEVRRKDWLECMIHHCAAVALLFYSYSVNFTRVGVMIMLVHDASDIFLEAAKLARYAKAQVLATGLFVVFAIIWVITRNVIFPFVLIRSTMTETLHYAHLNNISAEPHYTVLNSMLILLEILHMYWTYLIFKIIWRQVKGGDARDIREDDSDNDD